MRWRDWGAGKRPIQFAMSALFVGIVVVIRLGLNVAIEPSAAFLLFLAAVMASAWVGGTLPGLFATALSALAGSFFFIEPKWSFGILTASGRVEFVLFLAEGTFTAMLAGQLRSARNAALAKHAEALALQSEVLRVSEGERRRIGHDLHDGLGQHLTGIALLSRGFHQRLTECGSPEAGEAEKMSQLARTAVEWTHDLCQSLSPNSAGLAQALRDLAMHAENIFSVECNLEILGSADFIDLQTSAHLYRIAQEAVSNAVKHGNARRVDLHLRCSGNRIDMQVSDNGAGFDPTSEPREGMGLRIMRYRARIIGARLHIQTRPEGGTDVSCHYCAHEFAKVMNHDSN
jgi:signal transduction histidine kinase